MQHIYHWRSETVFLYTHKELIGVTKVTDGCADPEDDGKNLYGNHKQPWAVELYIRAALQFNINLEPT